jgi:LysM domain
LLDTLAESNSPPSKRTENEHRMKRQSEPPDNVTRMPVSVSRSVMLLAVVLLSFVAPGTVSAQSVFQKLGKAGGDLISGAGKAVGDGVSGVGRVAGQTVTVVGQGVGAAVGAVAPEAGNYIKDGARRLGNNVQAGGTVIGDGVAHVTHEAGNQVAENPIGVLITILCPAAAPFVLGAPTLLQLIACTVTENLLPKESCNVQGTLSSLSVAPVATLGEIDEDIAPLTTMFKCLGIEGWLNTGCEAVGRGHPVREAQHSQDGFWTIDLALEDLQIQGQHANAGRFLRLEIRPNRPAHGVASQHLFTAADDICFGGPVLIDKGKWLEVHPVADFGNCPQVTAHTEPDGLSNSGGISPSPSGVGAAQETNEHSVRKGECLARIAKEYYGRQTWHPIFRANRKAIKDPDLIFPGQVFVIPRETTSP